MEDVQNENVLEQTVETTTEQVPQPEEQTSEEKTETASEEAQERMVPISVVQKERKQRQDLQRKVAELEGKQNLNQYDPNDLEAVMQNPFVQELLLKDAKRELTDFARETLDNYPNLHSQVKKAILSNARGFVNERTTDVESAKLDLMDYIESIAEEAQTQTTTPPKTFKVATTNISTTDAPGARPAEIQKILAKPLDRWTDEEASVVEKFSQTNK